MNFFLMKGCLGEYTNIEHFFRYLTFKCEFKTCESILYLNIECYNLFISYYKIPINKNNFKCNENDLYYIYEKYKYMFVWSGSFVLSLIQDTNYNDIDIFIPIHNTIIKSLYNKYMKKKLTSYTRLNYKKFLNNKHIFTEHQLNIIMMIRELKKLGYKKCYNNYHRTNFELYVYKCDKYKEQFIFIDITNIQCIDYFFNSFDLTCVKLYYKNDLNYIRSKYPQIYGIKNCIYKHTIYRRIKSEWTKNTEKKIRIIINSEIIQPYRLLKYIIKGYNIYKTEYVKNFIDYIEKIFIYHTLISFTNKFEKNLLDLNNKDTIVINIINKEKYNNFLNDNEQKKIRILSIDKINKELVLYCFDDVRIIIFIDENNEIILEKSYTDFYFENFGNENIYIKITDINFLINHFR
jgi:hypothetical protein